MAPKKKNSNQTQGGIPGLDLSEIERVLAFMKDNNLEQFEFSRGDLKIALTRAGAGGQASGSRRGNQTAAPASSGASAPEAGGSASAPPAAVAEDQHIIKSPIVGTFFTAASPESAPFVKPGDRVKAGQVICIVEAMKLMNEIESDVSGVVVRALVENAQPVEYGQPLFAIRPDGKK
jgi:acetyl-CoA carboxylase biotin carboxyl carrier protein